MQWYVLRNNVKIKLVRREVSSYFWLNINPRKKCRRKPNNGVIGHKWPLMMTSSDNQGKGERYDWLLMNMSSHVFHQTHAATHLVTWENGQLHRNSKGWRIWNIRMNTRSYTKIFQINHPKALGGIYFSTSNLHLRPLDPKIIKF